MPILLLSEKSLMRSSLPRGAVTSKPFSRWSIQMSYSERTEEAFALAG
jgi:hypothetical protein